MSESLADRVGRLISGGVNAIVDAIENAAPEMVMEESIREIDSAIDEVRAELGLVVANRHVANTRLMDQNRKHESYSEQIEVAIGNQRDDLAEAAIAAQLDIEAQIPVLEATIADCAAREKELEGYISALQARKREMRDELRLYRESCSAAVSGSGGTRGGDTAEQRADKATEAFERVMERTTGIGAGGATTDRKSAAQLAELDELARRNRIQERLAAIKGKS